MRRVSVQQRIAHGADECIGVQWSPAREPERDEAEMQYDEKIARRTKQELADQVNSHADPRQNQDHRGEIEHGFSGSPL